jgi:hypothetical protein
MEPRCKQECLVRLLVVKAYLKLPVPFVPRRDISHILPKHDGG